MRGIDRGASKKPFLISEIDKTRGHGFSVKVERFRRNLRGPCSPRVNKVLESVFEAGTLTVFKC